MEKTDQEMKTEMFDEQMKHLRFLYNQIQDNLALSNQIVFVTKEST